MNSLYTLGVRQTNSIQADLERLRTGDASASLLGLSTIPTPPPSPPHQIRVFEYSGFGDRQGDGLHLGTFEG